MLNIDLHKATLMRILRAIYTDLTSRTVLGFKGGTAAVLFYGLPRFSVDLDFDLLSPRKKSEVFEKLSEILPQFGELQEVAEKRYTLFFLLRYEKGRRNLKVEISKRPSETSYEVKHYLGIPILVAKKEDMAAGKLSALLGRRKFAARDLFDLWFFLKNNWPINERVVKEKTGMLLKEALRKAEDKVAHIKKTQLLSGLGDLLDPKQKTWVKNHLQEELLFQLKLYQSSATGGLTQHFAG